MSLRITENNGKFYVSGSINTSTLQFFKTYFDYNLAQSNKVIINIDSVTEIDKSGLAALKKMTRVALQNQKTFAIEGVGCKEIYDDFYQTNVA